MKFQVVIRNAHEQSLAEFFSRGTVLTVENLPFRMAGEHAAGVDAVVPRLGHSSLAFAETQGKLTVLVSRAGEEAASPVEVHHGDRIELDGMAVHIFVLRARAKVAWRAAALGALAVIGVTAALGVQAAAFCAVPYLMNHSNRWRRQGELQAINYQTDALRKTLRKMEPAADPVNAACQLALLEELDERARFLRRHGEELSGAARREMLANLRQLDNLVGKLADPSQILLQPVELQVDTPVRKILESK